MASQIGDCLDVLAATIASRRDAGDESYTHRLLSGGADDLLKKLVEESCELTLAAKDVLALEELASAEQLRGLEGSAPLADAARVRAHARYEAGDVVYHLLVVLERLGISLDDLAAELNTRMGADVRAARPDAAVLAPEEVNRGKEA